MFRRLGAVEGEGLGAAFGLASQTVGAELHHGVDLGLEVGTGHAFAFGFGGMDHEERKFVDLNAVVHMAFVGQVEVEVFENPLVQVEL